MNFMAKISLKYITKNAAIGKAASEDRLKNQLAGSATKQFWQLCGVNLTVQNGQILGLVGTNSSGKSLLLQIIAQRTRQTTGFITNNARNISYANLRDFDWEQTGASNIEKMVKANPKLTMTASQVVKQIEEYTELGRWLQYPMNTYSFGQVARVSVAVALFMQADLVLIDDCLSGLDPLFQPKVLQKIREQKQNGVSFVIAAGDQVLLATMCDQLAWLQAGELKASGPVEQVLLQYQDYLDAYRALSVSEQAAHLKALHQQQIDFKIDKLYEAFKSEQFRHGYTRKDEPRMRKAFFSVHGSDPVASKVVTPSPTANSASEPKKRGWLHRFRG